MKEMLIDYAGFLLETVTVLVAFIIAVIFVAAKSVSSVGSHADRESDGDGDKSSRVVIRNESAKYQEEVDRLIHEQSERASKAFISINCAAMPDQLLESELFGYEGGAFTGALAKGKIGLFEAASGGTIFLDEIGDMPLALQSKLLRTLENHEIRRVGGVKNIPVDVRVICATNVNL